MEGVFAVWMCLAAALVAALEWNLRRRLVRHVQAQMQAAAVPSPAAVTPAAPDLPPEVEAAASPDYAVHDAYKALPEAVAARMAWTQRALGLMRLLLWSELAVAAAYLVLPLLLAWGVTTAWFLGLVIALAVTLVATVRHAIGRRQYRVSELRWVTLTPWRRVWNGAMTAVSWVMAAILAVAVGVAALAAAVPGAHLAIHALRVIPKVFTPRVRVLLSGLPVLVGATFGLAIATGQIASEPMPWAERLGGAGLMLAALVHGGVLVYVTGRMRGAAGSSLLVLRVFDRDEATDFTFNRLMRYWRLFGHHFTVVDASLVRQVGTHALGWGARLGLFISFSAAFALVNVHGSLPLIAMPVVFAGAVWGVLALARRSIDARFVRDRPQLLARLARLARRPRNLDLSFRHERALCHADTWFMVVGEFARRSDVVLMDLRGFSRDNQGCQEEIDFLFDTVPFQRIVFLLDVHADAELVVSTISARWATQRPDSPNVDATAPVIQTYMARLGDVHDVQALVDLLILAAQTPTGGTAAPAGQADAPPGMALPAAIAAG
jgi:hypothetical protein